MKSLNISHSLASSRILLAVEEKRLTQSAWHGRDGEGRHIACLLGSIDESVTSSKDCNGDLMPLWFAECVPVLFDGLDKKDIYPIAKRFGGLIAKWENLEKKNWDDILERFLIKTIDEAVDAARPSNVGKSYWNAVEKACSQSKDAIKSNDKKAAAGAAVWAAAGAAGAAGAAARAAARAAEEAAARAAARAAEEAADAAGAAEEAAGAAGAAARAAAGAAARAAAGAARAAARAAAGAARAAARAAAGAARAAAYKSLFDFVLDQIEIEINK